MGKRVLIILAFLGATFGYVAFEAYKLDNKLTEYSKQQASAKALSSLPKVEFPYFKNPELKFNLEKSAKEGNNLFVHFWATWCGPCETEFPELIELSELIKTKKNVKFLFVAVNDEVKKVKKFLKRFKDQSNFVILVDNDFVHQNHFGTFKLPETYLFGPDMKLIKKYVGPQKWMQRHIVDTYKSL